MWLMLVSLVSNTFPTTNLSRSSQPLSSQVPSCTIMTGLLKQAGVVHVAHIDVPCQHHLPNNSATLFLTSPLHNWGRPDKSSLMVYILFMLVSLARVSLSYQSIHLNHSCQLLFAQAPPCTIEVSLMNEAGCVHVANVGVSGQRQPLSPIHPNNPYNHSPRKFPLAQGRQGVAWWRSTCGPCWCPWSASPST